MQKSATAAFFLTDSEKAPSHPLCVTVVRGREQVLRLQPLLSSLAARCGQLGAVDYLEYFLTGPYVGTKTPCLFLVQQGTQSRDADNLQVGDLLGAVLMYEYRVRGIDTHIYVTDDDGGERTVLASPEARLLVASEVARALIDEGARGVLMSLRSDDPPVLLRRQAAKDGGRKRLLWTSRERTLRRTLPLETTFDQTLAPMGKHTRRNLRASRRRTETELQARFVPAVEISLDDFVALNRLCSYPVPDNVSVWRYETAAKISGGFMVGVISGNGEWLSLLGGRRHHGVTEIGWQMNRESLEEYSLSNVMRSYLIEHEISPEHERSISRVERRSRSRVRLPRIK